MFTNSVCPPVGREHLRAEHRGERRHVEVGPVDVPEEGRPVDRRADRVVLLVEGDLVDLADDAGLDLAQGAGEGDLLFVVDLDPADGDHAALLEELAQLGRMRRR